MVGAAEVHTMLLSATLDRVAESGLDCTVAISGPMDHPLVAELRARGLRVEAQRGADLGARLRHACRGPGRAVALGADCVCFAPEWLIEAAGSTADVSIGPAEDGGYWAIAVDESARAVLFEGISWSSPEVLRQTLERAAQHGLSVHTLPECYDVDTPEDLMRLCADPACPAPVAARARELLA
jgi:hypothetical protein